MRGPKMPAMLVVLLSLLLSTACAGASPTDSQPTKPTSDGAQEALGRTAELVALIDAANREGSLRLVWSESVFGGAEGAKRIQDAMNRMFGTRIQVQFSPGPAQPQVASQIIAEYKAGQKATSDVYYGAGLNIAALVQAGALEMVPWTKLLPDRIPQEIVELDQAIRQRSVVSGFTYNSRLVNASKLPQKMDDMLDAYWTGKVATTPYVAGFDFLVAPDAWGRDKTIDYLRKFSKQVSGLMRCGEAERIAAGEVLAMGLDCGGDSARTWKDRGAPVDHVVPLDAAQKRFFYLAVPKNAPNPNAAKLFTVFMMTRQGQELSWELDRADLDVFPESRIRETVQDVERRGAKFFQPSIKYLLDHPEMQSARQEMEKIVRGE